MVRRIIGGRLCSVFDSSSFRRRLAALGPLFLFCGPVVGRWARCNTARTSREKPFSSVPRHGPPMPAIALNLGSRPGKNH
jgi:hypothetical protein